METDVFHASRLRRRDALFWLGLIWFASRLPLLCVAHGADFDMESYTRVARVLSTGRSLYGDPELAGRYPYLPAWALLVWALDTLARIAGCTPAILFKLPAVLADLVVGFMIFFMVERLVLPGSKASGMETEAFWTQRPFWAALAWLANPLPLLIGAGHGQFDSVALGFVMMAAWYHEFSQEPRSDFASALCLGFAIAFKSWPAFFLPLFVVGLSSSAERVRYVAICLALPLLLLLPFVFHSEPGAILGALSYTGSSAFSFPEALRGLFYGAGVSAESYRAVAGLWHLFAVLMLLLVWLAYLLGPWRFPLFAGLAFATLTLYVFAPGLAPQYLCWLLPFALLLPGKLALRHSFVCLASLLLFYGLFMPEAFLYEGTWIPPQLPAWFFLIWALMNLGLWFYFIREWLSLWRLCHRPLGRLGLT
jgi:hypothetical protein